MALAWLLAELERPGGGELEANNFAALLERHPPAQDVKLVAPSSWSCPHGVERWRADCGCRLAARLPTQQRWRTPLRESLEWLASELHTLFDREAAALFTNPWEARDAYGSVVSSDGGSIAQLTASRLKPGTTAAGAVRARELLELERNALRMFTSCGWFFDDLAGIEPLQVLRYAARAIELAGESHAARLEAGLLERLEPAQSNDVTAGNGRQIYIERVKPRVAPFLAIAAAAVTARRLAPDEPTAANPCYALHDEGEQVRLTHCRTGREYHLDVTLVRPSAAQVVVTVGPTGDHDTASFELGQLPERQREAVTDRLRRELIERHIPPPLRAAVAVGAVDLAGAAGQTLRAAVSRLEADASPAAVRAVQELADLHELLGVALPFDAQTAFYRIWTGAASEAAVRLAALAWRLGFAGIEGGGD
jgi:hypothetical protein